MPISNPPPVSSGPGGSTTVYEATVTLPNPPRNEYDVTINNVAVTVASNIIITSGVFAESDENFPRAIDFAVTARTAGQFTLKIVGKDGTPISGVYRFNYILG